MRDLNRRTVRFEAPALRELLLARPFDREAWVEATGEKLHLRIANAPPALEREASLDQLERFIACVDGFGLGFCEVWRRREVIYVETDVQCSTPSGFVHRIPCAVIARTYEGLLQDLRFHLDPAPLAAFHS